MDWRNSEPRLKYVKQVACNRIYFLFRNFQARPNDDTFKDLVVWSYWNNHFPGALFSLNSKNAV